MRGFFDAVSLLTRVPTRGGANTARAVAWLPVVGVAIGLLVAGIFVWLRDLLTPLAAASVAVAAGILVTGALHEDGFADTADAFGARADRARTLEILDDPRHGTFGVLALVISFVTRSSAVAGLDIVTAAVVLPVAHALARGTAAMLLAVLRPATSAGLGATYARGGVTRRALIGLGIAMAIAIVATGAWALPAAAVAIGATLLVGLLAVAKIRGVTGDVVGAAEQLAEIGLLFLALAVAPASLLPGLP